MTDNSVFMVKISGAALLVLAVVLLSSIIFTDGYVRPSFLDPRCLCTNFRPRGGGFAPKCNTNNGKNTSSVLRRAHAAHRLFQQPPTTSTSDIPEGEPEEVKLTLKQQVEVLRQKVKAVEFCLVNYESANIDPVNGDATFLKMVRRYRRFNKDFLVELLNDLQGEESDLVNSTLLDNQDS